MEFYTPRLDEYDTYTKYYQQCMQMNAESSFIALWSYQEQLRVQRAFYKDLYWHTIHDQGEGELWLAPVGDWDRTDWRDVLAELVPDGTRFAYLPEYLKKLWERQLGDRLIISEARGEWDYLYHIDRQKELKGPVYANLRQHVNRFERNYNAEYSLITPEDMPDIITFQKEWLHLNENLDKSRESLEAENKTVMKLLENWGSLKSLLGAKLKVNGKIIAYIVAEELDENTVSGHILKGNYGYKGVYQAMLHMFYANTLSVKYTLENAWGDADIKNLRASKLANNPAAYIKKYTAVYNAAR